MQPTGAGVGGAKVELLKGGAPLYETTTDPGGRFRIDKVSEGDYAARYHSPDYWLTAGAWDYHPFHLAAGSPVTLEGRHSRSRNSTATGKIRPREHSRYKATRPIPIVRAHMPNRRTAADSGTDPESRST